MADKTQSDHVEMAKAGLVRIEQATVEELSPGQGAWATIKRNPRAIVVLAIVMCTALTLGIEQSLAGSLTGSQSFCKVMGTYDDALQSYEIPAGHMSAWTAIGIPFQLIGFYVAGFICDRWGRKWVLSGSMFVILVGAIVETVSANWVDWLVAKAIMAVSTGLVQSCFATYVAETTPRDLRGGALVAFQIFTNAGSLLSAVILEVSTARIPDVNNKLQYKIPLYAMIAMPFLLLIGVYTCLVESPAWLVIQDNHSKAKRSLRHIYPYMTEDEIEVELSKVVYMVQRERENHDMAASTSWISCFRGTDLRRTIVAIVPGTAWAMSGNILIVLSTYFFVLAGQHNGLRSTVIVQCTGIAVNIIATAAVELKTLGRFKIYTSGHIVMIGGMILIGAVGARWQNPGGDQVASNLLIAGVVIANIGCQFGPQAVSYLYASESGSALLRAKTTAISQSLSGLLLQLGGVYVPFMLTSWGTMTAFFFAGFGVVFWVISLFVVPDFT
ncbi:hypothetical protein SCUCBS95973_009804, partial [Sporothrix curviconia]